MAVVTATAIIETGDQLFPKERTRKALRYDFSRRRLSLLHEALRFVFYDGMEILYRSVGYSISIAYLGSGSDYELYI